MKNLRIRFKDEENEGQQTPQPEPENGSFGPYWGDDHQTIGICLE